MLYMCIYISKYLMYLYKMLRFLANRNLFASPYFQFYLEVFKLKKIVKSTCNPILETLCHGWSADTDSQLLVLRKWCRCRNLQLFQNRSTAFDKSACSPPSKTTYWDYWTPSPFCSCGWWWIDPYQPYTKSYPRRGYSNTCVLLNIWKDDRFS